MRWYDGVAIVVFAIAAMVAWMVQLIRPEKKAAWLAWSAALAPGCFYVAARSGGTAEMALIAGLLGGPVLAAALVFISRPQDVANTWRDGEL